MDRGVATTLTPTATQRVSGPVRRARGFRLPSPVAGALWVADPGTHLRVALGMRATNGGPGCGYLIRRLLGLIPVLFIFPGHLLHYGAHTRRRRLGAAGPTATPRSGWRRCGERLGLDQPMPIRYVKWLGQVVQGDLGNSILNRQSVTSLVGSALRVTLEQIVFAMLIAAVIALFVGITAALWRDTWVDRLLMGFALVGASVPTFWLGLVLIYVFSVRWRLLPPSGFVPFREDPAANLRSMVLPAFALGVYLAGPLARFIRSSLIEVFHAQSVTTARAKGSPNPACARPRAAQRARFRRSPSPVCRSVVSSAARSSPRSSSTLPGTGSLALSGILNRDSPSYRAWYWSSLAATSSLISWSISSTSCSIRGFHLGGQA